MQKPLTKKREPYGPRPHTWISGPDEYKHMMYTPWMRARAQANFRNEPWHLSFEEYYTIWAPHWANRGRHVTNVCMTRTDYEGAWTRDNIEIITRREHLIRQKAQGRQGGRGNRGRNAHRSKD